MTTYEKLIIFSFIRDWYSVTKTEFSEDTYKYMEQMEDIIRTYINDVLNNTKKEI